MNDRMIPSHTSISKQIYAILFQLICLCANIMGIFLLCVLLWNIVLDGASSIDFHFLTHYPSRLVQRAGILAGLVGTFCLMLLTALFSIPLSIGAAIYLQEYQEDTKITRLLRLNIQNLAGMPSVIYGMLGLTLFVRGINLGQSLLAGTFTIVLLILPIMTITVQETLKSIPDSIRLGSYAAGMSKRQVIYYQLLPYAIPGITTGVILSLSRAIGETAPLVIIGSLTFITFLPSSLLDEFTVLPLQIFNWTSRPQKAFHDLAAGTIIVLLFVLFLMNSLAIYLRVKYKKLHINNQ